MAESFTTTLEWNGSAEIGQRLASLVPGDVKSELVLSEEMATLIVYITADSLEQLRESVDFLLALFSDQD
jgi:hypothetical protein